MSIFVERTCTEVRDEASEPDQAEPRSLSEFRGCGAYVLLGAPGAGKTTVFRHEADETGTQESGRQKLCDARDFMTFDTERWSDVKTLFIDGLDEARAGLADGRPPLDTIRGKLDELGRPQFRLSCREADWFGAVDRNRLKSVSPDGVVKVLRLEPLSEDNVRDILRGKGVDNISGFINEATDRGIDALLSNPQTLELLAAAVADGNWPDTRTETFEAACKTLVRECNTEHLQAGQRHSDPLLLDTAGRLCAVQLLTGRTGYLQPGTTASLDDCIDTGDIPTPGPDALRAVLGTGLFSAGRGCVTPVHRHIAEFLAGRYLSGLIDAGLPVRRVLDLLTGADGCTISVLRGVAAWLAVHCKAARTEVVERDPLGTVLYGDVKGFSVDEKRRLLDSLERDAERDPGIFSAMHDLDSRWGDLATPDMEAAFRKILTAPAGSQRKQTVSLAVLKALERNAVVPGIAAMLLDIVRDGECWPVVRQTALEAYALQCRDQEEANGKLKALLADVYEGAVTDPFDDLLGGLLRKLYPEILPPAEVGRYLREQQKKAFIGLYVRFWDHDVVEHSTEDGQLADVLDSLVETSGASGRTDNGKSRSYWLRTIPGRLLAGYLARNPTVDHERLFAWLDLAAKGKWSAEDSNRIRTWFSANPASYKAMIRLAVDRYAGSSCLVHEIRSRLSGAVEPSDFGEWCLTQAAKTETNTKAAADFFLYQVVARQDNERISDETVEERLAHDPTLVAEYKKLQRRRKQDASESTSRSAGLDQSQAKQRRKEWRDRVKAHESALRENRAAPRLLHCLAAIYLGRFDDVQGAAGRERLRDLLGNDDLVDTVIEAFRTSPMRADLPDVTEIFRLADERKEPFLALPFLVGLNEDHSHRLGEAPLDEQGIRRALAFRFNFNGPEVSNQEPDWYRGVRTEHPDLVAEVLVRSVRASLRRGANYALIYELSHDDGYRPVAQRTVAPLLKSFPTKCKVEQLNALKWLLQSASRNMDKDGLLRIVESKLALRSVDAAQRMYWMCAGLLAAPAAFTDRLRQALAGRGHERRVRRMAEFLDNRDVLSTDALDVAASELLIESLGKSYRPVGWPDDGSETAGTRTPGDSTHTALFVDVLIYRLSSDPSRDASDALERLSYNAGNAMLRPWRLKLQQAAGRQREVRREADFRHPTVEQVLATLENRRPANAADLAALTMELLHHLAMDIRNGNTSPWHDYWNVDSYNHPDKPKPENACRDTLLFALRQRLPSGVDAQPEGTYADDKRADIRVSCGSFNVPVEIKRNYHCDLWTAIRQQLIRQYTRDPGADGYGIYLVFWFGRDRYPCKRPPTGPAPEDPTALRERLLAVAGLSPEETRKIDVCVIDVSEPDWQSDSIPS